MSTNERQRTAHITTAGIRSAPTTAHITTAGIRTTHITTAGTLSAGIRIILLCGGLCTGLCVCETDAGHFPPRQRASKHICAALTVTIVLLGVWLVKVGPSLL